MIRWLTQWTDLRTLKTSTIKLVLAINKIARGACTIQNWNFNVLVYVAHLCGQMSPASISKKHFLTFNFILFYNFFNFAVVHIVHCTISREIVFRSFNHYGRMITAHFTKKIENFEKFKTLFHRKIFGQTDNCLWLQSKKKTSQNSKKLLFFHLISRTMKYTGSNEPSSSRLHELLSENGSEFFRYELFARQNFLSSSLYRAKERVFARKRVFRHDWLMKLCLELEITRKQ